MKKILMLGLVGFLLSSSVFASEEQDRLSVFQIMKTYTKAVSCVNSLNEMPDNGKPTTVKDVITVEYNEADESLVFYVVWSGDMGCRAGSGTLSSYVTEVAKYGGKNWKPYTIQTDYAFGDNIGLNYKYIESVKKINSSKFEVISWDYADAKFGGEDGGSNFPANKFKYTIERAKFEPWKISHQALLEQKK
ncbi:hypothetical protein [Acinetobacter gerneri]|uniref:hypothetical protein n=1 Tax=Acinetobacter gerneri TaxID=202952 RepID=UPI0028AE4113|nr:hypothetical protein [Acinetobacter gerneri]